jgi:hypothetical protein
MKQQGKNSDKHKTKKTKSNSGLKRSSQINRAKTHNGSQQSTDSYACLKTIKHNFYFLSFLSNIN